MANDQPDATGAEGGTPIDTRAAAAEQDSFWERSFAERDYTDTTKGYDYYRPAYRQGWTWARERNTAFADVEGDLRKEWESEERGLSWEEALPAIRDAYTRQSNVDESTPGNPLV